MAFLLQGAGKSTAHRMGLPSGGDAELLQTGAILLVEKGDHLLKFGWGR